MKLLIAISLLFLAGCGSVGNPSVSETVARCRAVGFSDADIDSLFIVIESDRDRGFTRSEMVSAAIDGCQQGSSDPVSGCENCALAIVDVVFR